MFQRQGKRTRTARSSSFRIRRNRGYSSIPLSHRGDRKTAEARPARHLSADALKGVSETAGETEIKQPFAFLGIYGIGVLTWQDFEKNFGWANFFVMASSLSLARALAGSGASAWIAHTLVNSAPVFSREPLLVPVLLLFIAAPLRLLIPNIAGFLATTIPIATAIGAATGVNPPVCGLAAMIAGDAVLYYPAQSASSLAVYERGHLTAGEIFRFGLWMTLAAYLVVLLVALPYRAAIGEPLRIISRG